MPSFTIHIKTLKNIVHLIASLINEAVTNISQIVPQHSNFKKL